MSATTAAENFKCELMNSVQYRVLHSAVVVYVVGAVSVSLFLYAKGRLSGIICGWPLRSPGFQFINSISMSLLGCADVLLIFKLQQTIG